MHVWLPLILRSSPLTSYVVPASLNTKGIQAEKESVYVKMTNFDLYKFYTFILLQFNFPGTDTIGRFV